MGGKHTAANSLLNATSIPTSPPPFNPAPLPTATVGHAERRRTEEEKQGDRERKKEKQQPQLKKKSHTFHTSFQQEKAAVIWESPLGLNIPRLERLAQVGGQHREEITLTGWTPLI